MEINDLDVSTQIMDEKDENIRKLQYQLEKETEKGLVNEELFHDLCEQVDFLVNIENNVLVPFLTQVFGEDDWRLIGEGALDFDLAFESYMGDSTYEAVEQWNAKHSVKGSFDNYSNEVFQFPSATLNQCEIESILLMIRQAITVTDEDGYVSFYSKSDNDTLYRSKSTIQRYLPNCYPAPLQDPIEKVFHALKNKDAQSYELYYIVNYRLIRATYHRLENREGEFQGIIEVAENRTEHDQLNHEITPYSRLLRCEVSESYDYSKTSGNE